MLTCWDLQHRRQPFFPEVSIARSGFKRAWDDRELYYNRVLPRATAIFSGTSEGKQEITHFYRVSPDRVHVNPFFSPAKFSNTIASHPTWLPSSRFVVYPAQFWPHKNHLSLIDALKSLHVAGFNDLHLVLPGADKPKEFGTRERIRKQVMSLGLSQFVHMPGFVPDAELRWLYENAQALVFVSLFGPDNLPPLEAMSLSCPVIAADVPGALEQLGDAAMIVKPTCHESIAKCILKVMKDEDIRQQLINAGLSLVSLRSPERYVANVLQVIDDYSKLRRCWI